MHEHHRDRLREKALKDITLLNDYELLELILFGCIPRRNTNDIAHRLIDEFGSIKAVFSANPEMLARVDGVGMTTAAHIAALARVIGEIEKKEDIFPKKFTFKTICAPLIDFFSDYREEVFIGFFLDKRQNIISHKMIFGHETYQVEIDLTELSRQLMLLKPSYLVISHNHLSGNATPSAADDVATQKIAMVAQLSGVIFLDHLIVSKDKVYSYYYDGHLSSLLSGE